MRVTGGRARGILIKAPGRGDIRPATDYLREAVFSSLGPDPIRGGRVLDAFAGTGAYGIEALSRGATHATFIEKNRAARACLEQNLDRATRSIGRPAASCARILLGDFQTTINRLGVDQRFELIFVDPPYRLWGDQGDRILDALPRLLVPGGIIVAEAPGDYEPRLPVGLTRKRRLAKGPRQPSAIFFERAVSRPPLTD